MDDKVTGCLFCGVRPQPFTPMIQIAGTTALPDEAWIPQVVPNPIAEGHRGLALNRYPTTDRDTQYMQQLRQLLKHSEMEVIGLPRFSPNLNAFAEQLVHSIKEECLAKMIFVGQASLRRAIREYMMHHHNERNQKG